MFSLLRRLKILSLVSVNGTTRSTLIKSDIGMVFSTSVNATGFLDGKKRNWSTGYRWHSSKGWLNDISRYESSNGKLLAINGGIKFSFFSRDISDSLLERHYNRTIVLST